MFDRNTIIGLLMMLLLVVGYSWWQAPSAEEIAAQSAAVDSLTTQQTNTTQLADTLSRSEINPLPATAISDSANIALQQSKYGVLAPAAIGEANEVFLRNNKLELVINTKGGFVQKATLLDGYVNYGNKAKVELWDDSLSKMFFDFGLSGKGTFTSDQFFFTPSSANVDAGQSEQILSMKLLTADPAKYIEIQYGLKPDSYAVSCKLNIVGLGGDLELAAKPINYYWAATGLIHEKGIEVERQHSSVFYREMEENRDYLTENSDDSEILEKKLNWVAFKQNFFSAIVISKDGFLEGSKLASAPAVDSLHTMNYSAQCALNMPGTATSSADLMFYFGPNEFKSLKSTGVDELGRIIDYGPSLIGGVNRSIIRPMFVFFSGLTANYGIIILIITVIIKLLLFPVTWKNFLSSAKMRVIKPETDEINEKFKDKPLEKQQAIMQLYRQTGVNPFAGCIPVLLQMPILYAMFRFFPASIEFRGKSFLWADDLGAYDAIAQLPWNIPFYGDHVSGFTILMCISTFFYTKMSMAATPAPTQPGMPNMKVMMNIFTFLMLFFFNSFASGLTLYYFTANVVSIGQMWVIKNYIIDEKKIREKIEGNKKRPVKKGGFAQRLEDMQKQQQKKLTTQKEKLKK